MTRDEVYAIAVERDISGRSSMTKPELIDAILLDQGGM
ncbi:MULTISPECIES: Rho termination factor N-terminal domain-containing protein [unclassified Exiguobacterium]|nr:MULTISPECIES: Rho termination factor N-terminal domain-containing protein [unclassified Exiguobacterium]